MAPSRIVSDSAGGTPWTRPDHSASRRIAAGPYSWANALSAAVALFGEPGFLPAPSRKPPTGI